MRTLENFSICLTVFNNEQTIEKCLDSVIKTCPGAEVVIVESLSTDDTYDKIRKFEPRVRCVRVRCTRGRGFQLAAELSTTKYFAFIAGDWVLKRGFSELLRGYENRFNNTALLLEEKTPYVSTPLLIVPRTCFFSVGGYRPMQSGEDLDLWLRLAEKGLLLCTDVNPFVLHLRSPRARRNLKKMFGFYYGLSLAGFGMCWRLTPTFPIRFLAHLAAYPRRDKSNLAGRRIGALDLRIDFIKRLGILFNCYVDSQQILNQLITSSAKEMLTNSSSAVI
jgi:glycosyltransferase involved in cell wall biosynthesis